MLFIYRNLPFFIVKYSGKVHDVMLEYSRKIVRDYIRGNSRALELLLVVRSSVHNHASCTRTKENKGVS